MADSDVAITAGSGTAIHTFLNGSAFHDQIVREAPATAIAAPTSWTLATSAANSVIAADVTRRSVILWNPTTATVYLRYDGSSPTTAAGGWHDQIPPGARLEVSKELVTLAQSYIASAAAGSLEISLATAA